MAELLHIVKNYKCAVVLLDATLYFCPPIRPCEILCRVLLNVIILRPHAIKDHIWSYEWSENRTTPVFEK